MPAQRFTAGQVGVHLNPGSSNRFCHANMVIGGHRGHFETQLVGLTELPRLNLSFESLIKQRVQLFEPLELLSLRAGESMFWVSLHEIDLPM